MEHVHVWMKGVVLMIVVFVATYSAGRDASSGLGGGKAGQEDEREDGSLHLERLTGD